MMNELNLNPVFVSLQPPCEFSVMLCDAHKGSRETKECKSIEGALMCPCANHALRKNLS